jgi:hypothetical protein
MFFDSVTTGVINGAGTASSPLHMSSPPDFRGNRALQSLVFCVVSCR